MDGVLAASVVGRAVKYSRTIEFIDPHLGKRGRQGRQTRELKRTAEAILYVAEQWSDSSPYHLGDGVDVLIVTRGGDVGAGGFVDPSLASKAISLALKDCDSAGIIRSSKVVFKQDVNPSRFRARFIRAGQHCWSIGHEISDLARLRKPAGQRGDLFIEQDCKLFRKLAADISELPDA